MADCSDFAYPSVWQFYMAYKIIWEMQLDTLLLPQFKLYLMIFNGSHPIAIDI